MCRSEGQKWNIKHIRMKTKSLCVIVTVSQLLPDFFSKQKIKKLHTPFLLLASSNKKYFKHCNLHRSATSVKFSLHFQSPFMVEAFLVQRVPSLFFYCLKSIHGIPKIFSKLPHENGNFLGTNQNLNIFFARNTLYGRTRYF